MLQDHINDMPQHVQTAMRDAWPEISTCPVIDVNRVTPTWTVVVLAAGTEVSAECLRALCANHTFRYLRAEGGNVRLGFWQ